MGGVGDIVINSQGTITELEQGGNSREAYIHRLFNKSKYYRIYGIYDIVQHYAHITYNYLRTCAVIFSSNPFLPKRGLNVFPSQIINCRAARHRSRDGQSTVQPHPLPQVLSQTPQVSCPQYNIEKQPQIQKAEKPPALLTSLFKHQLY